MSSLQHRLEEMNIRKIGINKNRMARNMASQAKR